MTLSLPAPAKLNLFLHITGRRADGYHELQTLFQLLDYNDTLHFSRREDATITLTPAIAGVAYDENLIIKAALALKNYMLSKPATSNKLDLFGIDIQLDKKLPIGGGLGGGSSNAATTLIALNHLWKAGLNNKELCDIGVGLGADVPVFINGYSAWAEGIGDKLQPIELTQQWYLIIKPNCHVSTVDVFSREELTRDTLAIKVALFFEQGGINDCQNVVCQVYPEVKKAIDWLSKFSEAKLTGTGACVFATFPNENDAKALLEKASMLAKDNGWICFVARGINQSPIMSFLTSQ
jgi:4-diphosphocytidyl-2-C-methyl-D-erythritol kinase